MNRPGLLDDLRLMVELSHDLHEPLLSRQWANRWARKLSELLGGLL